MERHSDGPAFGESGRGEVELELLFSLGLNFVLMEFAFTSTII